MVKLCRTSCDLRTYDVFSWKLLYDMILGSSRRGGLTFFGSFFSCFFIGCLGIEGSRLAVVSATWGGLNPSKWVETLAASAPRVTR